MQEKLNENKNEMPTNAMYELVTIAAHFIKVKQKLPSIHPQHLLSCMCCAHIKY